MKKNKLSVVLATLNEEKNIGPCLESVKKLADEIIIVDANSIDETRNIAKKYGAKIFTYVHKNNFHESKQFAINKASGDWILQLDADERVSKDLANEIREVMQITNYELQMQHLTDKKNKYPSKWKLFSRHQGLIKDREGKLGSPTGEITAYFIPRINYFVGKPLTHAGVYPDAVIRLIKKDKARLPAKSVHELMEVDGEVGWLFSNLEHHDSPTLNRYIARANRYTTITANEFERKFQSKKLVRHLVFYSTIKPAYSFLNLYVRHRGYKDGIRGFLWSLYSALHFPLAYWKYWVGDLK